MVPGPGGALGYSPQLEVVRVATDLISRRRLLSGALAASAAAGLAACGGTATRSAGTARLAPPRQAGSRPDPTRPEGVDTLPQIDHVVVVMLENHSFDNILGTLGRGDGLPRGKDGRPDATNPDGSGRRVRSFHMPTPCQLTGKPWQTWNQSHAQYDGGTNQGFVTSKSGPVAMGYWDGTDLPFTASLASTFPIGDRYFSSVLAQTYPNRRYLMAATSLGLVADKLQKGLPPNGTIFDSLNRHGISWKDYFSSLPTLGIFISLLSDPKMTSRLAPISQFFADAQAGNLPSFSIVDPDFGKSSEEDPQDIQYGDVFLSQVVQAVLRGPRWSKTLLVWTYDEGGGYYDHVPPPTAAAPDAIAPEVPPGSAPGGFDRYGFRVPFGIVSPYARRHYVSHVVHDHTSVLKLVETKWNLPALTARDANADDLLDSIDLHARPAFAVPPPLASPANPVLRAGCQTSGPGVIPPPDAVLPA
jgi:phospholipase C